MRIWACAEKEYTPELSKITGFIRTVGEDITVKKKQEGTHPLFVKGFSVFPERQHGGLVADDKLPFWILAEVPSGVGGGSTVYPIVQSKKRQRRRRWKRVRQRAIRASKHGKRRA